MDGDKWTSMVWAIKAENWATFELVELKETAKFGNNYQMKYSPQGTVIFDMLQRKTPVLEYLSHS